MSYFAGAYLRDISGNTLRVEEDISGYKNLGTSMLQNVIADDNNSCTGCTILSGETWSGSSTSTLGVVGLQFSLTADQNCTVHIDQSPDGINWDITDSYDFISSLGGNGWTTQALNSYVRARVENISGIDITLLRCQMALCPIAEPLPRALSDDGRLKTESHISDEDGRHARVTRQHELLTSPVYRLVGTSLGTDYDTNFWLTGGTNGGSVIFNGDAVLQSSTDAAGTVTFDSVRKARFVTGSANLIRGIAKLTTMPVSGNTRRFGAYDDDNGYFYQTSGTTFGVGYRKGGVDTVTSSGSFNGLYGTTMSMDTGVYGLSIEYGTSGAKYYVDGKLLHTFSVKSSGIEDTLTQTLDLRIRVESFNEGSTIDNGIKVFNTSIFRKGELLTNPTSVYISSNVTQVLKYGAGKLHRIIATDNAGEITIYDGLSDAGKLMCVIDASKVNGSMEFGIPFNDGLTVVGSSADFITVYE